MKRGIYPAVLTPMNADLSLNLKGFSAFCRELLLQGVTGLTLFGTTGEANSIGLAEKKEALKFLVQEGIPTDRIIAGTGCCSLFETVDLTRTALECGIRHILMLPPFYYKAISDEGLFNFYSEVFDRVQNDTMRILLYHIPQVSGVPLSLDLVEKLFNAFPEIVLGVKDSSGDPAYLSSLCERFPRKMIFSGSEIFLLENLRMGGAGSISAAFNLFAGFSQKLILNWQDPAALSIQKSVSRIRNALQAYPMIPSLKFLKAQESGDPHWEHLRPPFVPLTQAQREALVLDVQQAVDSF